MTTSNCFSRALSVSTMSLEHFEALSTASPPPRLAATVPLMGFHPDNSETHTKEQGERKKKHDLVSRHLYFPTTGKHNFCIGCLSSSVSQGDSRKPDSKTAEPSLLTAHKELDLWEQLCFATEPLQARDDATAIEVRSHLKLELCHSAFSAKVTASPWATAHLTYSSDWPSLCSQ